MLQLFGKYIGLILLNVFITIPGLTQTKENTEQSSKDVYFKCTVDLPGKLQDSYVDGKYRIKCGKTTVASGSFNLKGLATEKDRVFLTRIAHADSIDWGGEGLNWEVKCDIYDAQFKDTCSGYGWNMSTFNIPAAGVGFDVIVKDKETMILNAKFYASHCELKQSNQ